MHLESSGGRFAVWPLVSFMDSRVFVFRYLVAVAERKSRNEGRLRRGGRWLPRQLALYSAADAAIRESASGDNGGNYWCRTFADGILYSLVFYEGRLSYWSEEGKIGEDGFSRDALLRRFRCFLGNDPLFSRVERFEEVELEAPLGRQNFNRAARDSFWRGFDLRIYPKMGSPKGFRIFFSWQTGVSALLIALLFGYFFYADMGDDVACRACVDAAPVELSEAPGVVVSTEPVDKGCGKTEGAAAFVFRQCVLPEFRLMGVVGGRLAMLSMGAGAREVSPGDSLGGFAVDSIGRSGVKLVCGDSVVERNVGDVP